MEIKKIILSAIILIIVDSVYLHLFSNFYGNIVNSIQNKPMKVKIYSAIICYLFLVFGLNYFILNKNESLLSAFLLGIVIYGVFESTNMAIFENWGLLPFLLDTIWGGLLFLITTYISYKLLKI